MFKIDFGTSGGGERSFADAGELRTHLAAQAAAVEAFVEGLGLTASQTARHYAQNLSSHWRDATAHMNTGDPAQDIARARSSLSGAATQNRLFAADSTVAQAFVEVAETTGPAGVAGALRLWNGETLGALHLDEAKGAALFILCSLGVQAKGLGRVKDTVDAALAELNAGVAAHRDGLEAKAAEYDAHFTAWDRRLIDERAAQLAAHDKLKAAVADDVLRWRGEWHELRRLFEDQLKLQAPVKYWDDRAAAHGRGMQAYRRWTWAMGLGGLALAALVAAGALELAAWLFADAFAVRPGAVAAGLRETWRYELGFAAAATLLYLTLYLWAMRIAVRMFMTEHHLAIDAGARARMTETYLALTKEGAASDADRAIVLAAIFRPVTDGLVKEDAMPAVSPAAMLAQFAGGRP